MNKDERDAWERKRNLEGPFGRALTDAEFIAEERLKVTGEDWIATIDTCIGVLDGKGGYEEEAEFGSRERCELASAAPDMAKLLLESECSADDGSCLCFWCQCMSGQPHGDDCAWLRVMKKAGIR